MRAMDSYSEVRRVRAAMSKAVGHDIRSLIAALNKRRAQAAARIIDPGTGAEQCDAPQPATPSHDADQAATCVGGEGVTPRGD